MLRGREIQNCAISLHSHFKTLSPLLLMTNKSLLLILVLCISALQMLSAQKLPSTLLWKISGHGLQKPSYLYGTMHLTDERIFNLGDSVYNAIEKTDGFAIEIDPEQFTPFVIDEAKKQAIETIRLKDMMQKDEFKKYGKALAKKLGKNEDEITTADIIQEKNKWIEESYSTGKMQTFLDVYLLDIAKREGKWIGGVEDIQDQENLFDMFDESDIQQLAMSNDDKSKADDNKFAELMIKSYINNDLNEIYNISYSGDSLQTDALLVKRNKKMAMRMDSLSKERSMVFAVGAAHLPGDKGVIELLKQRGFTVEPVFSSKKIKPSDYKVAEVETPWYNIQDNDNRYRVLMPGKAGDLTLYGVLNMKMYFDVFKSTLYMATAMQTPYTEKMADSLFGNVTSYYFNTNNYFSGKPVTINNVPGREFISTTGNYSRGYLLFKDGVMYMAIAMSMKKDTSAASPINKFLHSFTISEVAVKHSEGYNYVNQLKAYKIDVPVQPKSANDMLGAYADSTISIDLHLSTDPVTGAYYFFGTNEAAKGFFLVNDSTILAGIRKKQNIKFVKVITDTTYFKNGHRVLELGGMMKEAPLMLNAHYEFRGNRWYALVTMYDPQKGKAAAENYFNSFQMLDYADADWKDYASQDQLFTTWSPANFSTISKKSNEDSSLKYETYDSLRGDTYDIVVESFGKYFWQNNDSLLWAHILDRYKSAYYGDSILYTKPVNNGEVKGYELALREDGSHNIKRVRKLINGNKLYSLVTLQDSSEIFNNNNNKFFNSFRFTITQPNDVVYQSKAIDLLNDISSTDSVTQNAASNYLSNAPFTRSELPLLHKAILKSYLQHNDDGNDNTYDATREKIKRRIIQFEDSSSYSFAKDHYAAADDTTKIILLDIMAAFPTRQHFEEIKTMLLNNTPHITPMYDFTNRLIDTAALTATIFPGLFPLIKDSTMAPVIVRIADKLLDSNLIDKSLLQNYAQEILKFAQQKYLLQKLPDPDYDVATYSIVNVLGKMNTADCNAILQKWSLIKNSYLAIDVVLALLQNQQPINPAAMKALAADNGTRIELYDSLKANRKESLFPSQYLNQKSFAESLIYTAASDDEEPDAITYITQKTINFKGTQARFYFYKVSYGEDDDNTSYLACAGPFNVNTADISVKDADADLYYDEDYDASKLSDQINALIKQMQGWYKADKE